ncbi:hypothetical protein, partial [Nocardia asteroides]
APVGPEALRRPWLGRYLAAAEAVRAARSRGLADLRVSGFGTRLNPLLDPERGVDREDPHLPLLLWSGDVAQIHDPRSGRILRLSADTTPAAEALLATGSCRAAARYADLSTVKAVDVYFSATGIPLTAPPLSSASTRPEEPVR